MALEDYVPVSVRVQSFWAEYPDGRITTRILFQDFETGWLVIQAYVYRQPDDAEPAATGIAHELRDDPKSFVNKTSYVENCETSAVGRALGLLGYDIDEGIASREEVAEAVRKQNLQQGIKELNDGTARPDTGPGDGISAAQLNLMKTLAVERGQDLELFVLQQADVMPAELSKAQAKTLIDTLMAMRAEAPVGVNVSQPIAGARASDGATKPQVGLLAVIAKQEGCSVAELLAEDFPGITDPTQLTKMEASSVIKKYKE